MQPIPHFDELHAISDLHLGGVEGRQIFNLAPLLAAVIRDLTSRPKDRAICLVINGDFVDFLAEPNPTWFDAQGASSRLDRIATDPAFRPIFDALKGFVKTPGRTLAITLGNHDLELALPWVRARLLEILTGGNEAAHSRILLCFDGAGFRCDVGGASVLCIHGNEVDAWNVTDHEQIRRIGRDIVQGRSSEVWKPNAGTRMVIEVMNEIKRDHPFVDLLKPEFEAAVPALLVIRPDLVKKIAAITKLGMRMTWDSTKMRFGFLGEEADRQKDWIMVEPPQRVLSNPGAGPTRPLKAEPSEEAAIRLLLGATNGNSPAEQLKLTSEELLARAENQVTQKRQPLELTPDKGAQQLGMMDAVWKRWRGEDDAEILRAAFEKVENDTSFHVDARDSTFKLVDELAGPNIQYVITGHTHLRRALKRERSSGFYYNTGTWARLMSIDPDWLKNPSAFKEFFTALKLNTLSALDASEYVSKLPTIAWINAEAPGGVKGILRECNLGADGTPSFQTVTGSEFPKP